MTFSEADESLVCSDKNLTVSLNLRWKPSRISESSIDEYVYYFLYFLIKGSIVIFLIIFINTTYVIKFYVYFCSKFLGAT
jgi:hypothetical protein